MSTKTKPVHGTLATRAMLVDLSIGFWEGKRTDKKTTEDVLSRKKASKDAGGWSTRLVPKAALRDVMLARAHARDVHLRYTLPWCDEGQRILPADMFIKYNAELALAKAAYTTATAKFIKAYPAHAVAAKQRLGALYDKSMFPTPADLKLRFPWALRYVPLPVADDFRVAMDEEAVKAIREQITEDVSTAANRAMVALWERVQDAAGKLYTRLKKKDGVLRKSLFRNLRVLCGMLPRLNVTGDAELLAVRRLLLKRVAKKDPDVLRKNDAARAAVCQTLGKIMERMEKHVATLAGAGAGEGVA